MCIGGGGRPQKRMKSKKSKCSLGFRFRIPSNKVAKLLEAKIYWTKIMNNVKGLKKVYGKVTKGASTQKRSPKMEPRNCILKYSYTMRSKPKKLTFKGQ